MGYLKRRIIEAMEPKEEPPMDSLVERLRKWAPVVPVPPAVEAMNDAADEIERNEELLRWATAKLQKAWDDTRWIPVEERLPEGNGRYLVATDCDDDPYVDAASWFDGEWFTGCSPAEKWGSEVTHWMPLPEPPC